MRRHGAWPPDGAAVRGPLLALLLDGPLRPDALESALAEVLPRPRAAPGPVLETLDLAAAPDPEAAFRKTAASRPRNAFPSALLCRLAPRRHGLLLALPPSPEHRCPARLPGDVLAAHDRRAGHCGRDPLRCADWALPAARRQNATGRPAREQALASVLQGAPPMLALPWDRPRPATRSGQGGSVGFRVPPALAARVAALARVNDAAPALAWLALWGLFLARLSGQGDVVVGWPARRRPGRTAAGPGCFPVTAAVRLDCRDNPSLGAYLGRVRAMARRVLAGRDIRLEDLARRLGSKNDPGHAPLFQALFAFREATRPRSRRTAPPAGPLFLDSGAASRDIGLSLEPAPDGSLAGRLDYSADLLEAATMRRWAGHFLVLAEAASRAPKAPVLDLPLLTPDEAALATRIWSGAAVPPLPDGSLLPAGLLAACRQWPDRIAVADADGELSYAGLEGWSRHVAAGLRDLGVGPGDRVAVLLPRGRAWIATLWGVWRAGAAFLSLDPSAPPKRLITLTRQCAPGVLATSLDGARRLGDVRRPVLLADRRGLSRPEAADTPPDRTPSPDRTACLVFTSGSSGAPKGIRISHASLAFHAWAVADLFGLAPGETVLQFASPGFDVAMEELWPTLIRGGRIAVCPAPVRESMEAFTALVREHRVAVANLPARFFEAWTHYLTGNGLAVPPDLRLLVTGSEAVSSRALADWRRLPGGNRRFLCGYGPSETTVSATFYDPDRDGLPPNPGPLPLGKPLPGVRAYVLDERRHPVPPGCVGLLHLGGPNLARGYLRPEDDTAGAFVPDPFLPGERLYRPGDRARCLPGAGNGPALLLFEGRGDLQLKRRGFRIEPQEIEAALATAQGVGRCAVVGLEDGRLAALVEPASAVRPDPAAVAAVLADILPAYMLPDLILVIDRLPLLPSGKPDRLTARVLASGEVGTSGANRAGKGLPGPPLRE